MNIENDLLSSGPKCDVCERQAGYAPLDENENPDMHPDTPLGEVKKCDVCGLFACPDCSNEKWCCMQAED